MTKRHEIRCYEYVNHRYQEVRDVLEKSAMEVFERATNAAESRARDVAPELRVSLGSLEIATEIAIVVRSITEEPGQVTAPPKTVLELEWEAANSPRWFPLMRATLAVYPLTSRETQLDFRGTYDPPLGLLGDAVDAIAGHRIADLAVHRFVADVADYLRRTLE